MAALTLIPPSMIGPPEFVHIDQKDTNKPGLILKRMGAGSVAWIPWDLGALYYRLSLPAHADLLHDVVGELYPHRQLETDAHRLVEVTLMKQGKRELIHFLNLSGHSQTGYFEPVSMKNITVKVAGVFHSAEAIRNPAKLPVDVHEDYTEITVPQLNDYELVVLE
jgi:hypothetical protein